MSRRPGCLLVPGVRLLLNRTTADDVFVHEGRIVSSGPCSEAVRLPAGRFLLPGFVDAHSHLSLPPFATYADFTAVGRGGNSSLGTAIRSQLRRNLRAGVLAVRDAGSPISYPVDIESLALDRSAEPDLPMLVTAGRLIAARGRFPEAASREVTSRGLAAAVAAASRSSGWIKLIADAPRRSRPREAPGTTWTSEDVARAVEIAHAAGARVAFHAMTRQAVVAAVAARVDTIEHGWALTKEDIVTLGALGIGWTPTALALGRSISLARSQSVASRAFFADALENTRNLIREPAAAGVMLCGTDLSTEHGDVARDALKLIEWGLAPEAAMRALTVNGWAMLGAPEPLSDGSSADFVLFDRDPRDDPQVLLGPALVIRAGRALAPR